MEDIIEKIKEYKLFLALTAIGLLIGGYFLFHRPQSSASTIPDLYQSSSSTSSKEKVQTASSKEEKTVTSVSDTPRSLRSMSKELSNNQVSMSYAQIAESTMPFIRRVG